MAGRRRPMQRLMKKLACLLMLLGVLAIALWLEHILWQAPPEEAVVAQPSYLYCLFLDDHGSPKAPHAAYFIRRRHVSNGLDWAFPSFGAFSLLSGIALLLRGERRALRP